MAHRRNNRNRTSADHNHMSVDNDAILSHRSPDPEHSSGATYSGHPRRKPPYLGVLVDVVLTFVIYWAYAHFKFIPKCIVKVNKLVSQIYCKWDNGYHHCDNYCDHGLRCKYGVTLQFIQHSIPVILCFVTVIFNCFTILNLVIVDIMLVCIFWILEQDSEQ